MTNNEILQADLLDILFEHRNKAYGAYALRKSYDTRLLTALGAGLGMASLFVALSMGKTNKEMSGTVSSKKEEIVLKEYVLPQKKIEPPKQPEQPKQPAKQKPVAKTAQVKYVNKFDIKKDELVKTTVTPVAELSDKKIGDTDVKGKPEDNIVKAPETPDAAGGTGTVMEPEKPADFYAKETAPEFPGGPNALHKFLSNNLRTPDDLEAGERKMVKVRFKVDIDGSVTGFEIAESGGAEFDSEVLRVVRKMPRWKPAFQNGINVPVSFMIPVTFMGTE